MAGSFEAKKHGYRQTQDGVVVSFVLHPNDLDAAFAVAPLGTRYMIGFAEIGDDEKPVSVMPIGSSAHKQAQADKNVGISAMVEIVKHRTPFKDLRLSQQAGIRCGDAQFAMFLMDKHPTIASKHHEAADVVRDLLAVKSRSELDTDMRAAMSWGQIEADYQSWLTTQRYKDSYKP